MTKLNTASVSLAVTPTVVSTLLSHVVNRKPLQQRPTAHLSYHEGLHLIRSFLEFASHHTVEELQAFTSQWVPHPQWVRVDLEKIPLECLDRSASLIQAQLGPGGIAQVGGRQWWQWRRPDSPLEAEWIEMKAQYKARKAANDAGRRVMLYVHGGAYFFGSVDEHRYQMQRHARKLKARVFAPRYRLAPQFPFPCGLHDCLAAYLFLLSVQHPSTIILAGDSAGGGMVLSMLCVLRDQGIPLPAGGILISPWVDLTHSFPSVDADAPLDYIPQAGFHHKPSRAWPPPNDDDVALLRREAEKRIASLAQESSLKAGLSESKKRPDDNGEAVESGQLGDLPGDEEGHAKYLSVTINEKPCIIKDQIQMYTTNALLNHPLVSPIMQTTLGGLPPLLVMVGGAELLRDEQIYLAHKCANPAQYAPPSESLSQRERESLQKYAPTCVQLQVWDDLCHVAPTLSFTRPAKLMYRSVSQFGAWVLARAQKRGIDIPDDDDISVISSSASENALADNGQRRKDGISRVDPGHIGKVGDPLPPFKNHMIRQRVTRHGTILPLAPETELPGCCAKASGVGVVKAGTVKRWLATRKQWDQEYASTKAKVHKKIIKDLVIGFQDFGPDEHPPPTALAGRRLIKEDIVEKRKTKSLGLALWALWGSKHDEITVQRQQEVEKTSEAHGMPADEGRGTRSHQDGEPRQPGRTASDRRGSRSRTVVDEHQTDGTTEVARLIEQRKEQEAARPGLLSPNYVPETGVAGKRPFIDGVALPFSLKNPAETASMVTLHSAMAPATPRPLSP
ncbi:uncharacterized protein UV8b_06143 [Ustilaginoidea virens]|uniref:Alpha/beta hydrolase fold-3 domain-containing protein n=2 Tax=Ustilaginoidea virens TaxID=1159556 RepID=A0A8E5MJA7_USTVR|nr:uncharacterized protein UV8b_06143 [Ustilaginoidea virens]QUC21902.1 hypothetical protein UV8b_06143 [Ustilaginoidea virens]